jgi:hypothetical protein
MDLETFLTTIFVLCDDFLNALGVRLRQRGPAPRLSDSEVLAIELSGEFLGYDNDQALYRYFRSHHAALFPALRSIHRTTFARQAANLWAVKAILWKHLLPRIEGTPALSIIDSFPVPICRFARAKRSRTLSELAEWGYDAVSRHAYWGLRVHVRITWPGIITALEVAPANASDLALAPELLNGAKGWALGDRGYWSRALFEELERAEVRLLAPYQRASQEKEPWPFWLQVKRRRIETVIGQLIERYHGKKNWARDRWHLSSRWLRKLASHTLAVLLCQEHGLLPLRMSELVS